MKRRLFSLFLALTLVVGMLPAPAFAQETESTQATQAPTEASTPTEAPRAEPTQAPTEAPTEAPAAEPTQPATEAQPTEPPAQAFAEPAQDEAVTAVQAMIDALPDVEDMSESYLDALEAAYSAFDALSEAQQAQITGVEKLEALFGWVNSQVSTLAAEETISGEKTWNNRTFTKPVKLTGETTLTLVGDNKIECEKPLDLNGHKLTIQGTGTLELVGSNNSGATPQTSGAIYDSTWTSTSTSSTGRMVIESGTVIARDDVKNAVAVRYLYMDGGKLEAYGARSGIVTTELKMTAGSLYATGSTRNGIDMWKPYYVSVNGLNILVSNEPNAQDADMEDGTTSQIEDSEKKTVAIGKFSTSPSISVQAQQGYLYEATAKTATFALSGRNVDLSALTFEWTGTHTGLEAAASADGKTLTVTTDKTVQAGTYGLKVSAGGASRTAVVTVSGPPIRIYDRPVDTISTDPEAGAVTVSAYLTDGRTGPIDFQWKLEDGTPMVGYTEETVRLYDLVEQEMLTQDESKTWLQTIRIYCTLSYDGYSLNTDTVTLGLNSCTHQKVDHEGNCAQCGQKKGGNGDALIVREDGLYYLIANAEQDEANVGHFMYSGGNFYLTGDVPNKTVNVSCTDVGGKNVTLDLQEHTMGLLRMGNFPYGTFTVKNGTLGDIDTAASGQLILENILYNADTAFSDLFELTVQGEKTRFKLPAAFRGTTHLKGGHFEQGLDSDCAARALELLEDGFAFYDSANKVVDATDYTGVVGREIHVASHTCDYRRYGKCDCGRSCDHQGTTDENGYCTNCGTFVYPFAIGENRYTGLEAALTAAQKGDTVTLRGDYDMQGATVEITKSITLELNGHTLSSWPYEPILTILAPDVTIQNGTVKNTDTSKSAPAVQVGSLSITGATLTVKDAIFEGSESHGTLRNYGLSIFAGNTAQAENGTFTGGISVNGSLTLSGGKADRIYVGTGVTYASLLAKGYAYQSGGVLVKLADMNDSTAVQIVKCTHPDGLTATNKCPYCGMTCGHKNINQTTGLCPECGYQMAASLTVDGTTTFFDTFPNAAAAANGKTGALLTLLKDEVVQDSISSSFGGGKITIDWKGHTLSGQPNRWNSVIALDAAELTLRDSSGNNAGGIDNQNTEAILVRGGSLTIESGTYASGVRIPSGTATVKISGGIFKNDESSAYPSAIDTEDSRYLAALMAPGHTLALDSDGTNLYDVYANKATPDHTTVYVVSHAFHTFDKSGKCACGAVVPIQVDNGTDSFYFDDFESAVNQAKTLPGSTVRLLEDVTHSGDSSIYIDSGTFTIDWNGHTLSGSTGVDLLAISQSADVTLKDSSGTNAGGVRNTGLGAAVRIAVGSRGSVNIQGGTYSPNVTRWERCYGSVQISGGVFENPLDSGRSFALYDESGSPLSGMLVDGTAFAYDADGSELLDAYHVNKSESYRTVYVVAHTHESFDEDGVCDCGYTCPHEHWTDGMCDLCGKICPHDRYENGKCTVCGYPCPHEDVTEKGGVYTCDICGLTMTVMVETADGISYTTDLAAALNNAEDGTTVTLLGDVSLENSAYIKDGKEVTLNLNDHNITRAGWQTIQVKGNTGDGTKAKLVITGSGEIRFNVKAIDGGQLDMSGWTGTVGFVDLENACDFVGPTGDGHLGELNISNWRSDNKGTILLQGGTIGKLWLNSFESFQMTLGSLLKSGYAAKSGSEYLLYDRAISQSDNTLINLTIEPCPHTGLDSSGRCTYCNATGFLASVTKDGVTAGYTDFLSALDEICDGKRGTLKLLKDVPVEEGHPFGRISGILDLNGKNLACDLTCIQGSSLQIVNRGSDMSRMERLEVYNGAKVTIADTAGSIHFNVVWVEIGSVADLLPEGGAYIAHDGTWISAADAAAIQSLEKVAVKEAPVKSVTLTANKTSVPYGESQTVTLTASATLSEGGTASYAWAEVKSDGTVQTFPEEVGTSFTLPAGVNAGEHTYRVSVTAGDYTLSKDIQITVTKAKGTLENKDYPTEFTYGQTVPTPKAENFTSNHPDGTFSYYWLTGDGSIRLETGANPTRAGTYMLVATWTGGTNYTTASLSLAVTIQKAPQTANITVVNETISGKGDGGVTLKPSADVYEIRKKGETTFESISASQGETFHTLTPGVYEIRLAETKNYLPSAIQEITIQPGPKLTVTLPENQKGYTLTASKTQLGWHEDVELSFQLNPVGVYKAADFGIWAEAGSEKTKLTLGNDGAVKLTAPEKDITITVTGVKTDDRAPTASIEGREITGDVTHIRWNGFDDNPADDFVNGDFVISAADRGSGVASIWYCLSDKPLTLAEMDTASWVRQSKVSITEDGEYYLYVKALDKANNAGYACTGKLVKESNPPTFSGVENGKTYYVSQQMEIHDDGMPDWYMAKGSIGVVPNGGNENPIKLRLPNNGSSYTFTVGDRCGNEATITVYMKPLSDLTQPLDRIQEETIRKSDRATLDDVEATLKGLDVTYATEGEKEEINRALARIAQLRQVLDQVAAVEAQIDALPDSVEPYQQTVEDTQIKPARDAYNSLTDHQKTLVDSTKLDKLVRLEAQLDAWTITEGDGQTWYKGSWNPLSFTVNGQTRKFSKVLLDGKMPITATPSFLAVSGSIDEPFTLTLKPELLQVSMKPGEHTLTVIYGENNSGTGTVTFTVEIPANYLDVTNKPEFDGKTTVTVDGAEYPIEEMNGTRYVNLPETGDLLTIYSFKDGTPTGSHTNYPTGMQVFRITRQEGGAKAEEITEFANLLNYAGCSIRVSGKKGIRMITGIDQDVKKSLVSKAGLAGYTLEEYGTVVQWADTLGSNTLNLDNSNKKNYAYKKGKADPIFAKENGMIQYTNVLVGFTDAQCQPDLVMRPYIKLIDTATGETVTLYGGSVTRSIGYVAWQNRDTYKPGTASYKYVWNIIENVDASKYPN